MLDDLRPGTSVVTARSRSAVRRAVRRRQHEPQRGRLPDGLTWPRYAATTPSASSSMACDVRKCRNDRGRLHRFECGLATCGAGIQHAGEQCVAGNSSGSDRYSSRACPAGGAGGDVQPAHWSSTGRDDTLQPTCNSATQMPRAPARCSVDVTCGADVLCPRRHRIL